jgi:CubicO group peptidase (beta-lactamase class C family)
VRAATTPPSPRFEPGQTGALYGYGYQTWIVSSGRERPFDQTWIVSSGRECKFALWGLRGQNVFVDPARKLVMVNTSAGGLGDAGSGERLSLWYGVVDSVGR